MPMKNACSVEWSTETFRAVAVAAVEVRALAKREALREMSALRDFVDEPFGLEDGIEFDADEFASIALDAE